MGTIKDSRIDFEKLLNGIDPIQDSAVKTEPEKPADSVIDNTTPAEEMEQKMFEIDYPSMQAEMRDRSERTVNNIVSHVVPRDMIDQPYVKDKMEQDINLLMNLWIQVELNNLMQKTIVEVVGKGNFTPRVMEVFGQMTDKVLAINKQIIDTEQRLRKTYIDLKFELRDRISDDFALGVPTNEPQAISAPKQEAKGIIISNPKDLIAAARQSKMERIKDEQLIESK